LPFRPDQIWRPTQLEIIFKKILIKKKKSLVDLESLAKEREGEKEKGNKERHQVFVVNISCPKKKRKKKKRKNQKKKAGDQTQSLVITEIIK